MNFRPSVYEYIKNYICFLCTHSSKIVHPAGIRLTGFLLIVMTMHEFVLIRFWILLDSNPCLQYLPLADPRPDCEDVTRRILRWVSPVDELIPGVGGDPAPPPPAQLHSYRPQVLYLWTPQLQNIPYKTVFPDFINNKLYGRFIQGGCEGLSHTLHTRRIYSIQKRRQRSSLLLSALMKFVVYLEFMKHILMWTMFVCVHFRKHFSFRFCYSLHTWL